MGTMMWTGWHGLCGAICSALMKVPVARSVKVAVDGSG
jgi:hypothetical protein